MRTIRKIQLHHEVELSVPLLPEREGAGKDRQVGRVNCELLEIRLVVS
jgi:hypothetical protein